MMHFPPCFRFLPYFSKNFHTLWKIFTILPFPEKFLDFHPPKFLMTFFKSSTTNFEFPPIFPVSVHFPTVSRKLLFPPYFDKFPPYFNKNSPAFYMLHVYFVSPYSDDDAFMHHPNARIGRLWGPGYSRSTLHDIV